MRVSPFALGLIGLAGCGPTPLIVIEDAGPPDALPVLSDAGTDAPLDGGNGMWGPCVSNADCPLAGAVCDTAFPGGVCTVRCDTTCEVGTCYGGRCAAPCTRGANECAAINGSCYAYLPTDTIGYCISACFTEDIRPDEAGSCGPGLTCNAWFNYCGPASATLPPPGRAEGEPCTTYSECRGYVCIPEMNEGSPTGWVGGSCLAYGRQLGPDAYADGAPIPRSNCAEGLAMPPIGWLQNGAAEGDSAYCLPTCDTDAECREGYECEHTGSAPGAPTFSTGLCAPIDDCHLGTHTCPTGYECRELGLFSICAAL